MSEPRAAMAPKEEVAVPNPADERWSIRVVLQCRRGRRHELCVPWHKPVHPHLACPIEQQPGYGAGRGCCAIPHDLSALIERSLMDDFVESRRRGYILVEA